MPTVLVIDDDARLRDLLSEYLSGRGHTVVTAPDGEAGLARALAGGVDIAVLDIMMPGKDGLQVLRELRAASRLPVIVLTARGDDFDRIVGLELGADDYLAKPFNPRELTARIDAILRRAAQPAETEVLVAGPIRVDPDRRTCTMRGEPVDLTTTEFDLLRALVANAGRVIPREKLMELARGEAFAAFDRSVDVHVSHLRRKLGDSARSPALIKTVRGIGYLVPRDPEAP
ncbi:MAG: response regulator transcription factor [Alphaproteobacteria bacterium]|nr:response regulator transcription factor [Alphaproteobacteria bacterium]